MTGENWNLDHVIRVFEREVDARERTPAPTAPPTSRKPQPRLPTAATLVANSSGTTPNTNVSCVYCGQGHQPPSCATVPDISTRKDLLRKYGRCYTCLRKNHISKDCHSSYRCRKCRGKHHISICSHHGSEQGTNGPAPGSVQGSLRESSPDHSGTQRATSALCADVQTSVLLQTARLQLRNLGSGIPTAAARAIMDSGSQRTYITCRLRDKLKLPTTRMESLRIKTFGSSECQGTTCDVVQLGIITKGNGTLKMTALVVPFICSPLTSQPVDYSKECYNHLLGLELADSATGSDTLEIDVLIGLDLYWDLVTGRVVRRRSEPIAIHTKVGWVLSGPADQQEVAVNLTFTSTHALKVDAYPVEPTLEGRLKQFWDLESLGVMRDEKSVYDKFVQQIRFDGRRYEVGLPWKEHHPPLLDHFELSRRRLDGLLKRLRQTPQLLSEYDSIIQDQLAKGIVEVVAQPTLAVSDRAHYLPHHGVVRQDKATSKLRIVYDASARSSGPSLNDCLYTGPKFDQSIFDILLRFRLQRVALTGDIEKAFLMVSVNDRDRDSLRFLWSANPSVESTELITLRFTRVVFGVFASPFLLNATINHHMETYRELDPNFVDKFLSSIYVDDVVSGSSDMESAYEIYVKSKLRLAAAGFKLRKFVTNSDKLRCRISENEMSPEDGEGYDSPLVEEGVEEPTHTEEDQSYAKSSLGVKADEEQDSGCPLGRHPGQFSF